MCIFHKWGKWEQYTVEIPERTIGKTIKLLSATQYRQEKKCEKCGKMKDGLIGQVVHDDV